MLTLIGVAAFVAGALVGQSSGDRAVVERFVDAWAAGDYQAMRQELSEGSRKRITTKELEAAYRRAMRISTAEAIVPGEVRGPIDSPGSDDVYAAAIEVPTRSFGTLSTEIGITVTEGGVNWRPELVFPGLEPGEQLDRKTEPPPRASIVARDGTTLVSGPAESRTVNPIASVIAGEIGAATPERAREMEMQGFPDGTPAGNSGLELAFDAYLAGIPGGRLLAKGDSGRRVLARSKARRPPPLRTTIDPELQATAVSALGSLFGGTAVLDARNGDVLALSGIAFSAPQPPGSTFKIVTAVAALEEGIASPATEYPAVVEQEVGGRAIANAEEKLCGGTLVESFALSCNTVFAPLGAELGGERLIEEAEQFGFNSPPALYNRAAVEAIQPPASTIPGPIESDLEAAVTALGQGLVLATPLQMASVAQTIANDGVRSPTSIVKDPELGPTAREVVVTTPEIANEVGQMMREVVRSGTAEAAALPQTSVAGKTGTAELGPKADAVVDPDDPDAEPEQELDAWFAAYAPAKRPRYAVAVMIVNAEGDGGVIAAPIAREILAAKLP